MLHPYVSRRNTGIIMNGICNDRVYSCEFIIFYNGLVEHEFSEGRI